MRRRLMALALAVVAFLAVAVVFVPAHILRPFVAQTPAGVELAYRLRTIAPFATAIAALVATALAVAVFRGARGRAGRWLPIPAVLLVLCAAWLARQNHFEWMFNPLPSLAYASVAEAADFVHDSDMLIAVDVHGDAVAYPVLQMAYHHVANDVVGGVPVVSTY